MLIIAELESDARTEKLSVANDGNALGVTDGEFVTDALDVAVMLFADECEMDAEELSVNDFRALRELLADNEGDDDGGAEFEDERDVIGERVELALLESDAEREGDRDEDPEPVIFALLEGEFEARGEREVEPVT